VRKMTVPVTATRISSGGIMAIKSYFRLTVATVLVSITVLGALTFAAGPASAASRYPCAYEAVTRGCHIRPSTFHITPRFWVAGLHHWRRWNHITASGLGYVGSCGCDGVRLYLWRVRHHHFTRLNVTTQGLYWHYHWSWNGHRWRR